jgi:threonine synthase
MGKLVVATNENDILARFWKTGRYEKQDSEVAKPEEGKGGVKETLSPAMDILVSSNFERLLWYLALEANGEEGGKGVEGACETLKGWMDELKSKGRVDVGQKVLDIARRDFVAERVADGDVRLLPSSLFLAVRLDVLMAFLRFPLPFLLQTTKTIQQYHSSHSYVVDPHTAVGLNVTQSLLPSRTSPKSLMVTLSTAHPAKFLDAVQSALPELDFGATVMPEELRGIEKRERRVEHVKDGEKGVRRIVERYAEESKGGAGIKVDGSEGKEGLIPAA